MDFESMLLDWVLLCCLGPMTWTERIGPRWLGEPAMALGATWMLLSAVLLLPVLAVIVMWGLLSRLVYKQICEFWAD